MDFLEKVLLKVLKGKEAKFSIDSDDDGQPFIKGTIYLAELIDEARKKLSK
jgi:hypothetical protein